MRNAIPVETSKIWSPATDDNFGIDNLNGNLNSIEQGIDKRNTEIAKSLIEKGMDNYEIAEITGLTEVEIQNLRK